MRRGSVLVPSAGAGWLVVAGTAALVSVACASCGAIYDLSKLGPDDGADGAAPPGSDAEAEAEAGSDGAPDAAPPIDEDSSAPCVREAGGAMQRIGIYCIDAIEVTNQDYASFLQRADGGALPAAATAPGCGNDVDRVPTENWPPDKNGGGLLPVTGVSWCDAWAFCAYAGKRLCGRRGGGALTPDPMTSTNATTNEWYRACSKAGTKRLPYGNEPRIGECATVNELQFAQGRCEGGYKGIYDLVGNVEEWTNDCASDTEDATCVVQGGSALDALADCTTAKPYPRLLQRPLLGFRCCAD